MTQRMMINCAVLFALGAGVAAAADVSGKWTAHMSGPDGDGISITFQFQQDGSKLTGTMDGPGGEPAQIKDGKVDGDKISFTVSFDGGGGEMRILHEGTVKGDEITLNVKMDGGPGGGPDGPIILRRAK